jgi:hypothetical protein
VDWRDHVAVEKSDSDARSKVHRRELTLDGDRYAVLSPRPLGQERFATNRYHDTWHVLTGVPGARVLARVCWAMAYQRRPRTVFALDQRFLVPNPFDADPSAPIVVLNNDISGLSRRALADLKAAMPFRGSSNGTVTLQTHGLDHAIGSPDSKRHDPVRWNPHQQRRWIECTNGVVVVAAPPPVLRMWAAELLSLGEHFYRGSEELELDWPRGDGEVQILERFDSRVSEAVRRRDEIFPGRSNQELTPEERAQVWAAGTV